MNDFEVISTYTRADAIADGVLVAEPVGQLAREYGIKYPCAMTAALFERVNPSESETRECLQDVAGRVWDMLTMFRLAVRVTASSEVLFSFLIRRRPGRAGMERLKVKALCGPGDDGEPVVTFMLPMED